MTMELTTSLRAWLKLVWFMKHKKTEVGAFGITPDPDQPLYVTDLYVPEQEVGLAHVHFTEEGIESAMRFATSKGWKPWQATRLWFHTHPSDSVTPSTVDEETFRDVFGSYSWAVMAILGQGGQTRSCRLRIANEKGMSMYIETPWHIDYSTGYDQLNIVAECQEDVKRIHTETAKVTKASSEPRAGLIKALKRRFERGLTTPLTAVTIRSHRPWFNATSHTIHVWHPDSYKAVNLGLANDIKQRKGVWKADCWGVKVPWPQMYKWCMDEEFVPDAIKQALNDAFEAKEMDLKFVEDTEFAKGLDIDEPILLLPHIQ